MVWSSIKLEVSPKANSSEEDSHPAFNYEGAAKYEEGFYCHEGKPLTTWLVRCLGLWG